MVFGFVFGADRISGGLLEDLRLYDTGGALDAAVPRGDGVYMDSTIYCENKRINLNN